MTTTTLDTLVCPGCGRQLPIRRDGRMVAHTTAGIDCPGNGQHPIPARYGPVLAHPCPTCGVKPRVACWLPGTRPGVTRTHDYAAHSERRAAVHDQLRAAYRDRRRHQLRDWLALYGDVLTGVAS